MTQETGLALPKSLDEVRGFADAFVKSGMFSDTKQLAQAIVKIQAGRELGLSPVYSMQNINLIRNRLTTSANTMAMLVKKSGRYNYRVKEHHDKSCTILFYERDGDKWQEVGDSTFTIEDAKRADLLKPDSGWMKYPRAMLFSRAISQGARLYAPDAIGGVYTDEEIRAIPPRPDEELPSKKEKKETINQAEKDIEELWPEKTKKISPLRQEIIEKLESGPNLSPDEAGSMSSPATTKTSSKPPVERDPKSLKNTEGLARALKEDFGLTYQEMWDKLGIRDWNDLHIGLAEAYIKVKEGIETE